MRSEQEMFDLILGVAKADTRVKAVYMNGSRTNSNADKDIFQDYDIVYVVEETESFQADDQWIKQFGEPLYMQFPENSPFYPADRHNSYGWLIQFTDGNRLDLHVETVANALDNIEEDSLCIVLLDKEGFLPAIPPSTDRNYWVTRPTEEEFLASCNEFWWCLNNVVKGLWRGEITYAQDMIHGPLRDELRRLLSWKIGLLTDFSVSIGKSGKYMHRYLPAADWQRYLATYSSADIEETWNAVVDMCRFFEEVALDVAAQLGYTYNTAEAQGSFGFLQHVRQLPKDAKAVY